MSRVLNKLNLYLDKNALITPYANNALPEAVTTIGSALNYIISSQFPNAKGAVETEGDLPTTGNELNDYRIVNDYNSTGNPAAYRWTQLEGQSAPQWNLVQLFDSMDSILQQWETNSSGIFVTQLGAPNTDGQTIHGSSVANGNLTLSPNSGDASSNPEDQTGHIQLWGDTRPYNDASFDLGTTGERFASLYLSGQLSDGTNSLSVANAKGAYDHSEVTDANPHQTTYAQLLSKIGNFTVDGDVTTQVIDLSTGGDKTLTITITDDSHQHTVSTITDFNSATWSLLKARLVDTTDAQWTFNDGDFEASLNITIDTNNITDIASPAANKILVGNLTGDEWIASDGAVELIGDIEGSASYDSTNDKTSITTTVSTFDLGNGNQVDLQNLAVSVSADSPAVVTLTSHGMLTGRNIGLLGTSIDGDYTITKIDDDSFSIAYDNSGGVVESGYIIPDNSQLLYNSSTGLYEVNLENAHLIHSEISGLSTDDHTQYVKTTGRTDGTNNKVIGGELAGGNLYLQSTTDTTRGNVLLSDTIAPETSAVYSTGSWSGTDVGSSGRTFRHVYTNGEFKGFRLEQLASLPTALAQEVGRCVQLTSGKYYLNVDGTEYKEIAIIPEMSGNGTKVLRVNSSEDGIEYASLATGPSTSKVTLDTNATDTNFGYSFDYTEVYCAIIEYMATRNGAIQYGKIALTYDGATASVDYIEQSGSVGLTFNYSAVSPDVNLTYSTTNTAYQPVVRYSVTEFTA